MILHNEELLPIANTRGKFRMLLEGFAFLLCNAECVPYGLIR